MIISTFKKNTYKGKIIEYQLIVILCYFLLFHVISPSTILP